MNKKHCHGCGRKFPADQKIDEKPRSEEEGRRVKEWIDEGRLCAKCIASSEKYNRLFGF